MTLSTSYWHDSIYTSIAIDAPPSLVFSVLADFRTWSDWNPLIQPISLSPPTAPFTAGSRVHATFHIPGRPDDVVTTTLVTVDRRSLTFSWRYHLTSLLPLLSSQHYYEVVEDGSRCVFVHRETFSGLVIWLGRVSGSSWWRGVIAKTTRGFELMNNALKDRAERSGREQR